MPSRPHALPAGFIAPSLLGLEGIVSKRRNSTYRLGRSTDWINSKNPASAPGLNAASRSTR